MYTTHRGVAALSVIATVAAGSALADETFYVSTSGSNANDGSAAHPWLTIQHAADRVGPGDTVIVQPGTYAGFNVGEAHAGVPGRPVTFRAEPGGGVLINTAAAPFNGQTHRARINMDTTAWIVIDGFEVTGTNDQRSSKAGIRAVAPPGSTPQGAGFITVRNCHVHHNGEWGIFTGHVHAMTVENNLVHHQYDEHGVYLSNSGDNHTVRRNIIHSNSSQGLHVNADESQGGDGIITGVLVEENIIYGNSTGSTYIDSGGVTRTSVGGGSAINFDGVRDSVIRNNLLYANRASGISLYRIDGALPAAGNLVVNNTIINGSPSDPTTRWCINIDNASTGNTVFNNILLNYHSFRGSLIVSADSRPGLVSDHNVMMDRIDPGTGSVITLAAWRALSGQDTHSLAVAPAQWPALFTNLASWNLTLSATSAARDTGVARLNTRDAPVIDLSGRPRPQGPATDIGAYEHPSDCPADWNGADGLDSQDYFDFLGAFFSGAADFNGLDGTDSQDYFDFLEAFFNGCV